VQRTSSTPLGPIVARTGQEVSGFLNPTIHVAPMVQNGVAWFPIVSYASTVTLCLALAIVLLNRRELSYATD